MAIDYRSFRNPDPPALVRIWNEACTGRGAAYMNGATPLEVLVLAKPHFDPRGLILALEDGVAVGFAHAGFGPDAIGKGLNLQLGVICLVAVRPSYQRRGVGRELLRRAEAYLRDRGATTIQAGARRPLAPFYWGLHAGSEPAGALASDPGCQAFLTANQYKAAEKVHILDCDLGSLSPVADLRFPNIKRKHELRILPRPVSPSRYEESLYSPLEMLEFQLQDGGNGPAPARVRVWDMEHFSWRWHQPAAGIIDLVVEPGRRRQGLAKFLMFQMLRYLQDQFYSIAEVQVAESNAAARQLMQTLGFRKVDEGVIYRKE